MPSSPVNAAFARHDHAACCGSVLARADRLVRESGLRLTPVRRRALEILLEEHRALGAYEVLERLAAEGYGNQPPVAYRALEFLVAHGLAHRVRRLNAFAACMRPGPAHAPAFLICKECNSVAEVGDERIGDALRHAARDNGFAMERMNIEAVGLCPSCRKEGGIGAD